MNFLKKAILIVVILIVIIFSIIIITQKKSSNEIYNEIAVQGETREIEGTREVQEIDSVHTYFALDNCINSYYNYIKDKNVEAMKCILLDDYENQTYVSNTNSLKDLAYRENQKFKIDRIYSLESTYEKPYFIKGNLYFKSQVLEEYFIIFFDVDNSTFSITKIGEDEYAKIIKGNVEFKERNIEKNNYNVIPSTYFSDEDIARKYFYDYIENANYYPKEAYATLNEQYRVQRFGNYEGYIKYLKDNLNVIKSMDLKSKKDPSDFKNYDDYQKYSDDFYSKGMDKYSINKYDEYTEYIIIDTYGNYYIFHITAPMKYDLMLDTYTIDLPQFTKQYQSANIQGKVALNIQKFINAINSKDYNFAYNVLSDSYKNRYFPNEEDFEKYIKANLFENNNVEYKEFKEENNAYSYKIVLTDANAKNSKEVILYIAMQLEESGTGFRIAFSRE